MQNFKTTIQHRKTQGKNIRENGNYTTSYNYTHICEKEQQIFNVPQISHN